MTCVMQDFLHLIIISSPFPSMQRRCRALHHFIISSDISSCHFRLFRHMLLLAASSVFSLIFDDDIDVNISLMTCKIFSYAEIFSHYFHGQPLLRHYYVASRRCNIIMIIFQHYFSAKMWGRLPPPEDFLMKYRLFSMPLIIVFSM